MLQQFYVLLSNCKTNFPSELAKWRRGKERKRKTSHLTLIYAYLQFVGSSWPCQCSLSFLRRNTNFGFHNNPFWTGGMGHGLRYQRAGSEDPGCHLPSLPSTEERYQKHHVNPPFLLTSHRYSQRETFPVPHSCMPSKQKCRLYFLYCYLPIHLMWVTRSVHNGVGKGRRFISLYLKHGASSIIHRGVIKGTKSYSEKIIQYLLLINTN